MSLGGGSSRTTSPSGCCAAGRGRLPDAPGSRGILSTLSTNIFFPQHLILEADYYHIYLAFPEYFFI